MKNFLGYAGSARFMFYLVLTLAFTTVKCSFKDRVYLEDNKASVIYEHQLLGKDGGFQQTIDISEFKSIKPQFCSDNINSFCVQWADNAKLNITKPDLNCEIYEFSTSLNIPLAVTFDISNVNLFGGPEQDYQSWPAEMIDLEKYSYVSKGKDAQATLEPYWLVSNGMYLYVYDETPLFITQNKRQKILKLIAERKAPYNKPGNNTILKYKVCKFHCMKSAHMNAVQTVLGKPSGVPDKLMIKRPIWSTWAKYKTDINEETVMEFARNIVSNKLSKSQIEIDDLWETCYGSLTVNKTRFPDMKKHIADLRALGFRSTIWVHPFVNLDCEPFHSEGVSKGYFVKDQYGSTTTKWWNGDGSYIDFTNPDAAEWYSSRLRVLLNETGIDSYKFDAGETSWSPQLPFFHQMRQDHPETILKEYVKTVSKFGGMIEVRSGRGTQEHPIFVRMIDRETNWDGRLGLDTLIPCLLQMNMVGFPLVLPDMIGGNGYGKDVVTKEMFIRWLQINVFMPALQFSYPPWEFGPEVTEITRKFIQLHEEYSDKIIAAMESAVKTGTPVNPPLWWAAPHDSETYFIDDEFLLGEDILVAPIVKEGRYSRNIYLPKGLWADKLRGDTKIGPVWLYNYKVNLEELPFFVKIGSGDEGPHDNHDHDGHHDENHDHDCHHDDKEKKNAASTIFVSSSILVALSTLLIVFNRFFSLNV